MTRRCVVVLILTVATACSGAPLGSVGQRSSGWINEPTVPTTVQVATTSPTLLQSAGLSWSNDDIETVSLDSRDTLLDEIFARRGGDRFIQSSRFEIAVALPDVAFPEVVPRGARWVSSQLVFDNDGTLATDPTAAFGVWSAEPYSRSRSVAQMLVLRVVNDPETAADVRSGAEDPSCDRFAERNSDQCEIVTIGDRPTWVLGDTAGATLIWFDGAYRYELFGRSFVASETLQAMSASMAALDSFGGESS